MGPATGARIVPGRGRLEKGDNRIRVRGGISLGSTLGARLAREDAARFVGREAELEALEGLLSAEPISVVLVHGPGGIGKSAILRELARRAPRWGLTPVWIEGRDLTPDPDALEDAFAPARELERPFVVLDSYERISGVNGYLRRALLPSLPEGSLVVVASRQPPEDAWLQGGWERVTVEFKVGAIADADGREILGAHSVLDERSISELLAWAQGSPLALTLAADVIRSNPGWRPESSIDNEQLVEGVIRRLAGAEISGTHWSTLATASIARCVTVPLLADVLPDRRAEQELEWLRGCSFSEQLGEGIALHHLVREALYADLRRHDPERERALRRRVADHLYGRAAAGDLLLAIDLAHLIENPAIRWGYSSEAHRDYHLDDVRAGDTEALDDALRGTRHEALWLGSREFFELAPEHVSVVRDQLERPCGYAVAMTPATAPELAEDDEVVGPRLEHARRLGNEGAVVVYRDLVDLTGDGSPHVIGMLGLAGMLRAPLANPRYAYLIINPRLPGAREFARALRAEHVQELDIEHGGVRLECHLLDHGPGGMLADERAVIYRELGLPPPRREEASASVTAEAVREALRNLRTPHLLARSALAKGQNDEQRSAHVRRLLGDAADNAFGETPGERLMQRVLVRGYLDPAPSHELAADELSLSRSTYFRRLKHAAERVASYLSSQAGE